MSQKISGRLAYAGISKNNSIYLPEALAGGDSATIPVLLNHGDIISAEDIDESLLPKSYRDRLVQKEKITLGTVTLSFDYDNAILSYNGTITDSFYSQKHVLEKMLVSQGITTPEHTIQKVCGTIQCFEIISNATYHEMSLVFKPGLPLVTNVRTENTSHNQCIIMPINMETTSSNDNKKLYEDAPSDVPIPSQEQCPEGHAFNSTAGKCEKIDTAQTSNPTTNEPPKLVKKVTEAEGEDCEDCPEKKDEKKTEGVANADYSSEKKYLEHRLEQLKNTGNTDVKKLEHELKVKTLQESIRTVDEKLTGKAKTGTIQSTVTESAKNPAGASDVIFEEASPGMVSWLTQVIRNENVMPAYMQKISKEGIYRKNLFRNEVDYTGRITKRERVYPEGKDVSFTEAINAAANLGISVSNQVFVMPNGKIVTPVRQFCETKILNEGETEAFFYDIDDVLFSDFSSDVDLSEQDIQARSVGGEPNGRGKLIKIPYRELHRSPFDLMSAIQRNFAFESVNDESVEIFSRTYNNDSVVGAAANKKPVNGGVKSNWVNGSTGDTITTDDTITNTHKLSFAGILAAKKLIEDTGVDVSDLVLYTSTKGVQDLIRDPEIDSYVQFSKPEIITEADVARIGGINIVKSSAIANGTGTGNNEAKRSVLFKPFVSFGLITERDLTMEAQRRNELQKIFVTGTQIIKGVVKQEETTCRISHTNVI